MILVVIAVIILFYLIYFCFSLVNSHDKLIKLYKKYMEIENSRIMKGKDIAFLGKRVLGLDVKIAYRDGLLTDSYSIKSKIIIMSEEVCNSSSIASAGIVAHEIGHAVQHKNKTFLFSLCRILNFLSKLFCGFAFPCSLVGGVMWLVGWHVQIGQIILAIGVVLFFNRL